MPEQQALHPGLLVCGDVKILSISYGVQESQGLPQAPVNECSSSLPEVLIMFLKKLFGLYDQGQTHESTATDPRYPSVFYISVNMRATSETS